MNKPYTYLIGWSKHNKWYYGVRHARDCDPSDLWVKYFTSSKYVERMREQHGEPDVIQVRKIFSDAAAAAMWEEKVLHRMNVIYEDRWLNKACGRTIVNEQSWNKGKKFKYPKIKCELCSRPISKQNMSRHLYTCSGGQQGVRANTSNRVITKTFEFECAHCKKVEQRRDTKVNRARTFCSTRCMALARPIHPRHKGRS